MSALNNIWNISYRGGTLKLILLLLLHRYGKTEGISSVRMFHPQKYSMELDEIRLTEFNFGSSQCVMAPTLQEVQIKFDFLNKTKKKRKAHCAKNQYVP